MQRREFLSQASRSAAVAATAGAILPAAARAQDGAESKGNAGGKGDLNSKVNVAVVGVRGRGGSLLSTFTGLPTVNVRYVCDLDPGVLKSRVAQVESRTGSRPEAIQDFRKALDDKSIDAIVLGTPDHWHALPTIMACQAGKDVYVEKPDGHNLLEGRTMVEAAKKYKRVVQLGTQARSGQHLASAIAYIESGKLGKVLFGKAWESARQGSIGHPPDGKPPEGIDYDFWLGPAPKRAFNPRRFHGSWRWFFDYGTGDLGNDGVHRLDNARRALNAAVVAQGGKPLGWPRRVSAHGGKYYFDDDQEWPDTLMVTYDYPGCVLTYEMRVWSPYNMLGEGEGAAVFGDLGYIVIGNSRWQAFGPKHKLLAEDSGSYNDVGHAQNFIDCMHSRGRPNADLETVGQLSSGLCHLGNAAWRAGRSLTFNADTFTFEGDEDANRFITRPEYRKPWTLPKISEL